MMKKTMKKGRGDLICELFEQMYWKLLILVDKPPCF